MNGLTALRALELAGLQRGQFLAISGGAGLLAHYAIVIAKRQGLKVIADAKPEEADPCTRLRSRYRGRSWTGLLRAQFAKHCPTAPTRCSTRPF